MLICLLTLTTLFHSAPLRVFSCAATVIDGHGGYPFTSPLVLVDARSRYCRHGNGKSHDRMLTIRCTPDAFFSLSCSCQMTCSHRSRNIIDPLSPSVTSSTPYRSDAGVVHTVMQCDTFAVLCALAYGDIDSLGRWIARVGHNAPEKRQPSSDPRPPLRHLLIWVVDRPVTDTKTMYAQCLRVRVWARKICIAYTGQ